MSKLKLDLTDIQGNLLLGYGFPYAKYLYYRVSSSFEARQAIANLIPLVTTSGWWKGQKPAQTLNVALTFRGLSKLELPAESLTGFPTDFQQGLLARSKNLNNVGKNAPEYWDQVWKDGSVDLMLTINAMSPEYRAEQVAAVSQIIDAAGGLELVGEQDGNALQVDGEFTTKEHFGYTDGTGNPDIEGTGIPCRPGRGLPVAGGNWNPIKAGEFLLGYEDEGGAVPEGPEPHLLSKNGSFLVYMKLHQNVATFRKFLDEKAKHFPGGKDLLKAKMVGRWDDGTPLELSPHQKNPGLARDPMRNNDFSYEDDPDGIKVPLGAHIRRMNPRDSLGFEGRMASRHRIARRGLPYGEFLPYDQEASDNDERGINFMVVNASFVRQFEFVWKQWANYGNDFGLGNERDAIIGNRSDKGSMIIPGDPSFPHTQPAHILTDIPQFVELRGGDYFFVPSMTALRLIAEGSVVECLSTYDPVSLPKKPVPVELPPLPVLTQKTEEPQAVQKNESFCKWLLRLPLTLLLFIFGPIIRWAKAWAAANPLKIFWLLRTFKPILIKGNLVTVSRYKDVLEILKTDQAFYVTYAEKMAELTDGGEFFLGMQPGEKYDQDVTNMRRAVHKDDLLKKVIPVVEATAQRIVSEAGGSLNVATDLGLMVPTTLSATYLGIESPNPKEFSHQASLLFRFLFIPDNPPEIDDRAIEVARLHREMIDHLIENAKSTPPQNETILTRCLELQTQGVPRMDDTQIRDNLMGLYIGMIPTTAKCAAQALDQLLSRPESLAGAQQAALANNDALLAKYVFEALRFNPNNPGLVRKLSQDYVLSGKQLKAGMDVVALTWSAMFDNRVVSAPNEFRLDRPAEDHLHFGSGMHECFGERISRLQIPLILKTVLKQPNLRRAEGDAGKLQMSGPFPSSLTVEFDTE